MRSILLVALVALSAQAETSWMEFLFYPVPGCKGDPYMADTIPSYCDYQGCTPISFLDYSYYAKCTKDEPKPEALGQPGTKWLVGYWYSDKECTTGYDGWTALLSDQCYVELDSAVSWYYNCSRANASEIGLTVCNDAICAGDCATDVMVAGGCYDGLRLDCVVATDFSNPATGVVTAVVVVAVSLAAVGAAVCGFFYWRHVQKTRAGGYSAVPTDTTTGAASPPKQDEVPPKEMLEITSQ
eukprot:TRINITY_DN595_c0_g1_i2.p1 TRINITY_DN595_c0_g1~~TRINITY_DN595_c0_g1_i2.p1  ORF type:complete len:241 (+),score=68.30 TRINITY_DN595_c0_g1_i2:141-863(+)